MSLGAKASEQSAAARLTQAPCGPWDNPLSPRIEVSKRAYKQRDDCVPATNRDTGRTVYVLDETLKERPERFRKLPSNEAGDPRWRGKPKPPREPRRPQKPEIPREPPPAPIHPIRAEKPVTPMKEPNEVEAVARMKEPRPSPARRWKAPKKRVPTAASVVRRFLRSLERKS